MNVVAELNRIKLERDRSLLLIAAGMTIEAAEKWDENKVERSKDGRFASKSGGSSTTGATDNSAPASGGSSSSLSEKTSQAKAVLEKQMVDTKNAVVDAISNKDNPKSLRHNLDKMMAKAAAEMDKAKVVIEQKKDEIKKAIGPAVAKAITEVSKAAAAAREALPNDLKKQAKDAFDKAGKTIGKMASEMEITTQGVKDFGEKVSNFAADMAKAHQHPEVIDAEARLLGVGAGIAVAAVILSAVGIPPNAGTYMFTAGMAVIHGTNTGAKVEAAYIQERNKRLASEAAKQIKSIVSDSASTSTTTA